MSLNPKATVASSFILMSHAVLQSQSYNSEASLGARDLIFNIEGDEVKLLDDHKVYTDVNAQKEVSNTFLVSVVSDELNLLFYAKGRVVLINQK
jgi:hypothetical protein